MSQICPRWLSILPNKKKTIQHLPDTRKLLQKWQNLPNVVTLLTTQRKSRAQHYYLLLLVLTQKLFAKLIFLFSNRIFQIKFTKRTFVRELQSVWRDWAIYWTLGNFSKPLTTMNLPKSLTFLVNFCKGVNIYHFSSEIIFGQLL